MAFAIASINCSAGNGLFKIRDAAKIHGLSPVCFFLRPGHEYDGKLKAGR